jgi:hypothetical protein
MLHAALLDVEVDIGDEESDEELESEEGSHGATLDVSHEARELALIQLQLQVTKVGP